MNKIFELYTTRKLIMVLIHPFRKRKKKLLHLIIEEKQVKQIET